MVYLKEDEKKDSSPLSSNFINGFLLQEPICLFSY